MCECVREIKYSLSELILSDMAHLSHMCECLSVISCNKLYQLILILSGVLHVVMDGGVSGVWTPPGQESSSLITEYTASYY